MSQGFTRNPPLVSARKNSAGAVFGPESRFNFIEGGGIEIAISQDSVDGDVDVTISERLQPGAFAGYLDLDSAGSGSRIGVPTYANGNDHGFSDPVSSLEFRLDINIESGLGTSETIFGSAGGTNERQWGFGVGATSTDVRYFMSSNGTTWGYVSADTTVGLTQGTRIQLRVVHSGTTVTIYSRDPATHDLNLDNDANWTTELTDSGADNISGMADEVAAYRFATDTAGTGSALQGIKIHEVWVKHDGQKTVHLIGGRVSIDATNNRVTDELGVNWGWGTETDPTVTANSGDHGQLTGLADDDHTQYIRVDGTRAFTGDQSLGTNSLTSVFTVGTGEADKRIEFTGSNVEVYDSANVRRMSIASGSINFYKSDTNPVLDYTDAAGHLHSDVDFHFDALANLVLEASTGNDSHFRFETDNNLYTLKLIDYDATVATPTTANRFVLYGAAHASKAGDIEWLQNDGTTVTLHWDESATRWELLSTLATQLVLPRTDNTYDLGNASESYRDIYLTTGINNGAGTQVASVSELAELTGGGSTALHSHAGGGGGLDLTTKGGLHTFTTVDFELPVGANGTLLQADSAEASGLGWDTILTGEYRITGSPSPLTLGAAGDTQFRAVEDANGFTLQIGNNANTFTNRVTFRSSDHATEAHDIVLWDGDGSTERLRWDESTTAWDFAADVNVANNNVINVGQLRANGTDETLSWRTSGGTERAKWDLDTSSGGLYTDQTNGFAPWMDDSTLTDVTTVTTGSWQQYGTEEVTLNWPSGASARVFAWATCSVGGQSSGTARARLRAVVSFNGGSTWTNPFGQSTHSDPQDVWQGLDFMSVEAGSASGSDPRIQVRAEYQTDNTNTDFLNGRVGMIVFGAL